MRGYIYAVLSVERVNSKNKLLKQSLIKNGKRKPNLLKMESKSKLEQLADLEETLYTRKQLCPCRQILTFKFKISRFILTRYTKKYSRIAYKLCVHREADTA